jgi:hypothetical protein
MLEEYNEDTENVALFLSATSITGLGGTAGGTTGCDGKIDEDRGIMSGAE